MSNLGAFVLAGGKSSRMGADKVFLRIGERTFLDHSLRRLQSLTKQVKIVGPARKFSEYGVVVEDVFSDCGPLGGIHAALAQSNCELNLMLAVDLPYITIEFLRYLVDEAQSTAALVTVPQIAGHWQPLCAVYRKGFASFAAKSMVAGNNRIDSLFPLVQTKVLQEKEFKQSGSSKEMFRNLNTPEDVKLAKVDCALLEYSPEYSKP